MTSLLALALLCQSPSDMPKPVYNTAAKAYEQTDAGGRLWRGSEAYWLRAFVAGRDSAINERAKPKPKAQSKPVRYGDAG